MQEFLQFPIEEALIMIPALVVIGVIVKHTEFLNNKWIPLLLLGVSIILTPLVIGGYTAANIVQAILAAGGAVLAHQIYKQNIQKEKSSTE